MSEDSWMFQGPDPRILIPDYWHVEVRRGPDGKQRTPSIVDANGGLVYECYTIRGAQKMTDDHNVMVRRLTVGEDVYLWDGPDPEPPMPDYWHVECNWDPDGEWEEPNVIDMDGLLVCQCETVELARQLCERHNARVKEAEDAETL